MSANCQLIIHLPGKEPEGNESSKSPEQIRRHFEDAGKIFNAILILAHALDLEPEARQLAEILDSIDSLPNDTLHIFLEEDLDIMLQILPKVNGLLHAAIDPTGKLSGPIGDQLRSSMAIAKDEDGFSYIKKGYIFLGELADKVEALIHFLHHARESGLMVEKDG